MANTYRVHHDYQRTNPMKKAPHMIFQFAHCYALMQLNLVAASVENCDIYGCRFHPDSRCSIGWQQKQNIPSHRIVRIWSQPPDDQAGVTSRIPHTESKPIVTLLNIFSRYLRRNGVPGNHVERIPKGNDSLVIETASVTTAVCVFGLNFPTTVSSC